MITTVGDIDVRWFEAGVGNPVVLIHGLGDDHRAWRRVAGELMLDHRVILYNLRGHGETESAAPTAPSRSWEPICSICAARSGSSARRSRASRSAARSRCGQRSTLPTGSARSRWSRPRAVSAAPPAAGTRSGRRWSTATPTTCARRSTTTPLTSIARHPRRPTPVSHPPLRDRGPPRLCQCLPGDGRTGEHPLDDQLARISARDRRCSPAISTSTVRRAPPRSSPPGSSAAS